MRLAFITETFPPEINGVALTVERTVSFLRQRGHVVDLIRPRQAGEAPIATDDEWHSVGCPLPMYPELRCGFAWASTLARRFAHSRPDLVHLATPGPLARSAATAARRLGRPLTGDFRTAFAQYSRHYRLGWAEAFVTRYLRALHDRMQRTFVPSSSALDALAAAGFSRLAVIGRGVDTALFTPLRRCPALRSAWSAGENAPVLLYVGRLAQEKNIALALRAFERVRRYDPTARLVVVGDGPLRSSLKAACPAAIFPGTQRGEALACHYASADFFVFPSESETFGNVTLEAMASGLTVIAFARGAAADHIVNTHNGLTVPCCDAERFVDTVSRATALPAPALGALRRRARHTALALNWESVLSGFEHQLIEVVDTATATPSARHGMA